MYWNYSSLKDYDVAFPEHRYASPKKATGVLMANANVVQPGDVMSRVGVEVIRARGVDVEKWERDKKSAPSGHFGSSEPGHAPYSKNASFYIPG
jgi:hypothetical protein